MPEENSVQSSNLQPHQLRVIEEKRELDEKISKLEIFLNSLVFDKDRMVWVNPLVKVENEDQILLEAQLQAMETYSRILEKRIGAALS